MGLDVAFNREKALEAGLETSYHYNGTLAEARKAKDAGDLDHAEWLARKEFYIVVPLSDRPRLVQADEGPDDFIVRANKWGSTYAPLTQWLQENGISWSEF